uniref:Uncharacterized protein n=1 Tax=Romanomermis culicivorax TaxID=13658 RepID=A0A915KLL1_ROMCU
MALYRINRFVTLTAEDETQQTNTIDVCYKGQIICILQIAAYLFFAHSNKSAIAKEVKLRPQNGSLILYTKKDHSYKSDGYSWKRRKEGKVIREDHMRLKVKSVELIHANYVHSSLMSTFHRRAYFLLWNADIILVHYLNTSSVCSRRGAEEKILNNLRQCSEATALGDEDILDQLESMLHNCDKRLVDKTAFREILNLRSWLESILNKWRNDDGNNYSRNLSSTVLVNPNSSRHTLTRNLPSGNCSHSASTSSLCIGKDNSKSDIIQHNCANVVILNGVNISEGQPSSSDWNQYTQKDKFNLIAGNAKEDRKQIVNQLKLLLLKEYEAKPDSRTLIFVRTRELALAVEKFINEDCSLSFLNAGHLTGVNARKDSGGQTEREQQECLERFRKGEHKLMVATTVAEEGLDISKCNLVIKYNHVTNEIALVQRRGRGRAEGSKSILLTHEGWIQQKETVNLIRERLMKSAIEVIKTKSEAWLSEQVDLRAAQLRQEKYIEKQKLDMVRRKLGNKM